MREKTWDGLRVLYFTTLPEIVFYVIKFIDINGIKCTGVNIDKNNIIQQGSGGEFELDFCWVFATNDGEFNNQFYYVKSVFEKPAYDYQKIN